MKVLLPFLVVFVLIGAGQVRAQSPVPACPTPKHSDLFGLEGLELNWPIEQIRELRESTKKRPENPTLFFAPAIVKGLYAYHSACSKRSDFVRFKELIDLYAAIFGREPKDFAADTADAQIDLLARHLDRLVNDDRALPKLIYTMDDGPLYGTVVNRFPKASKMTDVPAKFGSLKIAEYDSKIYVGAFDKGGKELWVRVLKRAHSEQDLRSYASEKLGLEEFGAVSILTMIADGERLRLFVRPDGRFVFYLHSC
ncbi:MAG: hypothetical protein QUS14_03530 [Pyrinomonadaceae bacterium]|nr:hypothetical protein [Pyrinomonadaceae bacterium]